METKFEMLLEEYNEEKLILIGMPLEKLPLNCDGLPVIVQKVYDYIIDYGRWNFVIKIYTFKNKFSASIRSNVA